MRPFPSIRVRMTSLPNRSARWCCRQGFGRFFGGAPLERPVELRAGDNLCLDPGSRRVWRAQDELNLTARETAVLEFLLRRKGTAVSKHELLDNVWDDLFEGDLNIVEVDVRRLRNKVDRPYGLSTITTVRGVGYRLDEPDA